MAAGHPGRRARPSNPRSQDRPSVSCAVLHPLCRGTAVIFAVDLATMPQSVKAYTIDEPASSGGGGRRDGLTQRSLGSRGNSPANYRLSGRSTVGPRVGRPTWGRDHEHNPHQNPARLVFVVSAPREPPAAAVERPPRRRMLALLPRDPCVWFSPRSPLPLHSRLSTRLLDVAPAYRRHRHDDNWIHNA